MYDDAVLKSAAQTLMERQDDPRDLLEDLLAVKAEHADTPREFRRFQLLLELDADDLEVVISEVENEVTEDGR